MATNYPYVSSAGHLIQTVERLRKSFPAKVTAETLKKLGIAPNNESYVINVLRFLGVIDEKGKKVEAKSKVFLNQDDAFAGEFSNLVTDAYGDLFELHGDDAWTQDRDTLTQFFRTSDHSTAIVGSRQAGTFITLAGVAEHSKLPATRKGKVDGKKAAKKKKVIPSNAGADPSPDPAIARVGLTVRIEVNLPAEGDQATYDRIFQSIRKNLIDAE